MVRNFNRLVWAACALGLAAQANLAPAQSAAPAAKPKTRAKVQAPVKSTAAAVKSKAVTVKSKAVAVKAKAEPQPEAAAKPEAPPQAALQSALSASIQAFKAAPDQGTLNQFIKSLREYLGQPAMAHLDLGQIMQSAQGLSEMSPKVLDAQGARVWTFPKLPDAQVAVVQWQQATVVVPAQTTVVRTRRGRRRATRPAVVSLSSKAQIIQYPANVSLRDARIVHDTITQGKKRVETARYLVFAGSDKATGHIYLQGYKNAGGVWTETSEILGGIPPFLMQNVQGKAQFSGQDVVLTVTPESALKSTSRPMITDSNGYKLVLKLSGGHYALEGKSFDEGPTAVAQQFVQALSDGKLDLAKGWLQDPKLINIPKYIGLIPRKPGSALKLIAMANPLYGGARYRLVTYLKDDLILEVGKVKGQWAIKGIFIAPTDPLAQNLANSLPIIPKAEEPKDKTE